MGQDQQINQEDLGEQIKESKKQQRYESVRMACELLQKGFIPNISGDINPIQAVTDWIEEAYDANKKTNTPQSTNQDVEERLTTLSGILVNVNKTANRADKQVRELEAETKPKVNRNTNLSNLLTLDILVRAEGTLLDVIGKALDLRRLTPETDLSYRTRLQQQLE